MLTSGVGVYLALWVLFVLGANGHYRALCVAAGLFLLALNGVWLVRCWLAVRSTPADPPADDKAHAA